jgi:ribosome-associated translation inhibitor RaiA
MRKYNRPKLNMKIRIQSFSFHVSDELIGLAENTLIKLNQQRGQIKEAQMTLTIDAKGPIESKVCSVKLGLSGYDLVARKQCQTFERAILEVTDDLRKRLMHFENNAAVMSQIR